MATAIDERTILESLRRVPVEHWDDVLRFLETLHAPGPAIETAADLARSGLIGVWADRDDIGDGRRFADELRRQAETRPGPPGAARH